MPIESAFVVDPTALARLAPDWDALSSRLPIHPLSLSHQYFMSWRQVFGGNVHCGAVTLREAGILRAVMPVMLARCLRGPLLSVRFDYYPGDDRFVHANSRWRIFPVAQLSPPLSMESGNLRGGHLFDPTVDQAELRRHLAAALMAIPGWTYGIFPIPMDERDSWLDLVHDGALDGIVRPGDRRFYKCTNVLPWDATVQKMSRNARKSVGRAVARAEEAGLRCVVFDRADNIGEGMRHLATVAGMSWKETGRDRSPVHLPFTDRQRSFYETLAGVEPGYVQAIVFGFFAGEQCRAAALVIRSGRCLTGCITCYDPEIASLYPGRLVIKAMTNWAAANGIERMDFNATDPWVEPFSDLIEEYGQLVIYNRGPYGRLLRAAARLLSKPS